MWATPFRRPLKPDSGYVHRLLAHLEASGFDGAPRFLGLDSRGRGIYTFIEGFAPPHNGFPLHENAVAAGARLLRTVHDLTAGTGFAAGAEVACHPNLSQPNFVFREMVPVAIIDWDGTRPGTHPRLEPRRLPLGVRASGALRRGEPAARMLRVAVEAYGWAGDGLVDEMLAVVRSFNDVNPEAIEWGGPDLEHLERNADLFRVQLCGGASESARSCTACCW